MGMDPATRLDALRALALLPIFAFVPLVLLTLLAPARGLVERWLERDRFRR